MSGPSIDTTAAAFIAGLVTSVHCAGMCGPLACAVLPGPSPAYHGGRFLSYGLIGAVCGGVGAMPSEWLSRGPVRLLPWLMVALFVMVALGLQPKLPRPLLLQKFLGRLKIASLRRPVWQRAAMLGLLTPLLPCGALFLMFSACLLTGSWIKGFEFATAFALGTVPLLWVAQGAWGHLTKRVQPVTLRRFQRAVALLAAGVLAWRLRSTLGYGIDSSTCHTALLFLFP